MPSYSPAQRWGYGSADYELLWPRELFVRELTAVRNIGAVRAEIQGYIARLLEEAFLGPTPARTFRNDPSAWSIYVADLLDHAAQLREHHAPPPYWSARRHGRAAPALRSAEQLRADFAELLIRLDVEGYLARAARKRCVDEPGGIEGDLGRVLADRIGVTGLWPPTPTDWSQDLFYDLIEVVHDLVARPRTATWHRWDNCGYHYSDFATDIGRALYRWHISQLLAAGGVELQLAENGVDIGRLVRSTDHHRDLIEQVLQYPEPSAAVRVEHAIAQFRGRSATEHDRRSAVLTLAGILEERRSLLKEQLGRKDEGALFQIANEFAVRHQNRGQKSDYDASFLDWIFWWYLATVDLTNRLLARGPAPAS